MEFWKLFNDVENRNFEIHNGKDLLEARKKFLNSLFSGNTLLVNKMDSDDRQFLVNLLEKEFTEKRFEAFESAKKIVFKSSSNDEEEISNIKKMWNKYEDELKKTSVTDNLEKYLTEQKETTYYYIGINKFVMDYYMNNPDSEWKIKAILQLGFPFEFADSKAEDESDFFSLSAAKFS